APTNGACGIVPAVLAYYDHFIESVSPDIYIRYFMAAGAIGRVVTAPTNGACGIVPAVLAYYDHFIESVSPDIYIRYF
ncbi:L-serine ammonia-lyase, iron-sulfur-dependent, subunit alpha, partial [Enterobacter hormaechei]|uniref:L-serine ammonia-lyase, iron-sulfur-dependent, subunit alpha n=1 Tax=Enterobacter hormaechei TaxID=158836 RepID=UPI001F0AAFA5